ncbi:MAG: glycosyltransferase [Balneolales bacterium]
MRLLFVGHTHHLKTHSCDFFVDILARFASIVKIYITPESLSDAALLDSLDFSSFDAVVLWQVDFLSAFFLSRGCCTICVPMLDASIGMPAAHWRSMSGALVISFSRGVHVLAKANGLDSIFVRYFPEIIPADSCASLAIDNTVSLFFWERNPASVLNSFKIVRCFSGLVDRIHVHQAPDRPTNKVSSRVELQRISRGAHLSFSSWFQNKELLDQCLANCQIFVAPRLIEGIGMSFLGPMAAGCIVVAHKSGTHSDYLIHGRNGYLLDFEGDPDLSGIDLTRPSLSKMASRLRVDSQRFADAWSDHYRPSVQAAICAYVDRFSCSGSRFVLPFPSIYCFAAHLDVSIYILMLESSRREGSFPAGRGRRTALARALDLLEVYGEDSLHFIKDMIYRPIVSDTLSEKSSLSDLVLRLDWQKKPGSLDFSEDA